MTAREALEKLRQASELVLDVAASQAIDTEEGKALYGVDNTLFQLQCRLEEELENVTLRAA